MKGNEVKGAQAQVENQNFEMRKNVLIQNVMEKLENRKWELLSSRYSVDRKSVV